MSADNYAVVGIHPFAGTGVLPETLHGVYVGFMSNVHQPSAIPMDATFFNTHEEAVTYADELETEYGVSFLCDCPGEDEEAPLPELGKELLYPATKKTVQQVIAEYADTLNVIYEERTAGEFTWKGLLHEFMDEIAMTEDE